MQFTSESVEALVEHLTRLPTIGRKSAHRLAAYILKMPTEEVTAMANALIAVKQNVLHCSTCFNITDHDPCPICSSSRRNKQLVCVVEEPNDLMALERMNEYKGVYHVLGGVISPLDGIGPEDLSIKPLIRRITAADSDGEIGIQEVILAMNPNVEGDTTAYYLTQLIKPFGVKVSRIARGLPIGGDLEFADEATLSRALEGRVNL